MPLAACLIMIAALDLNFWLGLMLRRIMVWESLFGVCNVVGRVEIVYWWCWSFGLNDVLYFIDLRSVDCFAIENSVLAGMRNVVHLGPIRDIVWSPLLSLCSFLGDQASRPVRMV